MNAPLNLEQLRKQAKELARAGRAAAARRSWPTPSASWRGSTALRAGQVSRRRRAARPRAAVPRRHRVLRGPRLRDRDRERRRGRRARRNLAQRHGFPTWSRLRRHVQALHEGEEPPTRFILAYRAVEAETARGSPGSLDAHPELVTHGARTGTTCSGWRTRSTSRAHARPRRRSQPRKRLRMDEAPQAGYGNSPELGRMMLGRGRAHRVSARGDGGRPGRRLLLGPSRRRCPPRS